MSVTIEDVLALIHELFPGVQLIPLKNIRPNPNNPGKPTEKDILELMDNLSEKELVNAIKVRPDRTTPLTPGVQLHPSNPRLRGDGQSWKVEDFNWEILAGENRFLAFDRLKREVIPGYTLYPTEQEAVEIMRLDNALRKRGWWDDYLYIELEIKANPNLSVRQVAANLKMDRDKVSRGLRLLPLLSAELRGGGGGVSATPPHGLLGLG